MDIFGYVELEDKYVFRIGRENKHDYKYWIIHYSLYNFLLTRSAINEL